MMSTRPIFWRSLRSITVILPNEMATQWELSHQKILFLAHVCIAEKWNKKRSVTLNGNNIITFVARKNQLYVYFFPSFLYPHEKEFSSLPPVALHQDYFLHICMERGEKFCLDDKSDRKWNYKKKFLD